MRALTVDVNKVSAEYIKQCIEQADALGHTLRIETTRRPDLKIPDHKAFCTCGWESKKRASAKLVFAHSMFHIGKVLGLAEDSELLLMKTRGDYFGEIVLPV